MIDVTPMDASLPDPETLVLEWSDGQSRRYELDDLRSRCPCAECVEEWTGRVLVKREDFPGIGLKAMDEVGRYAFRIVFSDGHDTGLFTWKLMKELGVPIDAEEV